MKAISPIVALVIIVVVVVGASLFAYYLNSSKQVFVGGWEVTAKASHSYTSSTSAGTTDVTLDTGQTTSVGWDGKAVAVIATVQKYWGIENGYKYYGSIVFAHGEKGSEPWGFLPGDCYKVSFLSWWSKNAQRIDTKTVKIVVDKDDAYSLATTLQAMGLKVTVGPSTTSSTQYEVNIQVGLYNVDATGEFDFSSGSKGLFGSCSYNGGYCIAFSLSAVVTGP